MDKGAVGMLLAGMKVGMEQRIRRVGGNPAVKKHLEEMGLLAGERVTVVATLGGSLIVQVRESRVALSRELANHIVV